jgi:hypothetical protein
MLLFLPIQLVHHDLLFDLLVKTQAPILFCERLLAEAWRATSLPPLPRALRVVLTNSALIAVAGPLFFGPADESGFVQRNISVTAPFLQQAYTSLGLRFVSDAISGGS